eukprot:GHVN01040228.1.p1 GENE.GHVN01040228.1~~GHVN01040228.1.p1  ORF type:complete len:130 (+),score=16.01 GHVN01040228.1:274-663(+)
MSSTQLKQKGPGLIRCGLQHRSMVRFADDLGVVKGMIITAMGRHRGPGAHAKVIIRDRKSSSKLKGVKSQDTMIVRTKVWSSRKDGILCRFTENSVVAMKKTAPVGSMVKGPVPFELHHPIMAIASKVV